MNEAKPTLDQLGQGRAEARKRIKELEDKKEFRGFLDPYEARALTEFRSIERRLAKEVKLHQMRLEGF